MTKLESWVLGEWVQGDSPGRELCHAVTGEPVAEVSSTGIDFRAVLEFGKKRGGTALREMTFHQRARMLKALAQYLMSRKEELYEISAATGATRSDSWIDIEGGIGTVFTYASKGRRELPDTRFHVDGSMEALSKGGTFVGQHVCVPLEGVALHINAFNFPCWGMLEKMAPSILAGMATVVKPATVSGFLANRLVQLIDESGLLPVGALQLISGGVGDLFDHLTCQDVVTFTGSASVGRKLRRHRAIGEHSIRFNMEADSLNCSILGPDATPESDEFALFVKEVVREMTVKAGQKCTAIRRILVPKGMEEDVIAALKKRLSRTTLGDPSVKGVRMGPLASLGQVSEVKERVAALREAAEVVHGDMENFEIAGGTAGKGAFCPAQLLYCADPHGADAPHDIEAFGPVSTVMPYDGLDDAIALANRGLGSLCSSLFTLDNDVAKTLALGVAPYHGRILINNRHCAGESTGHGSPLPHLVHGGPGRAGGGEELGGMRAVMHYMQRTALQGSPTVLTHICEDWMRGADRYEDRIHPFRKTFDELKIGDALVTHRRTITEADVVNFGCLSGDHFYAHFDEIAARESFFERRVAHGYLVLAIAAGLFVDPAPGPVIANYGLDNLRFIEPVYINDTIQVKLTCKQKTRKDPIPDEKPRGVVAWDVEITNQDDVVVALYTILTLVEADEAPVSA